MSSDFGKQLKLLRTERGLSIRGLADLASVSAATISRIEAGDEKFSFEAALRLTDALGGDLSSMVHPSRPKGVHVKRDEQAQGQEESGKHKWRIASSLLARSGMEILRGTLETNVATDIIPVSQPGPERGLLLLIGKLTAIVDGETFDLGEGDALFFTPYQSYQMINKSDEAVEYLLITASQ